MKYRLNADGIDGSDTLGTLVLGFFECVHDSDGAGERKITGIPPIYYWYQMQQQMEVCNLDRVDFVECQINEYWSKKEFIVDVDPSLHKNDFYTKKGAIKNIIVEYFKKSSNGEMTTDWLYPENFIKLDKMSDWVEKQKKILIGKGHIFSKEIFFKIDVCSCSSVWRDKEWWQNNKKKYEEFWKEVEFYRRVGYQSLIKEKKKRKKRVIKCLIED